MDKCKKCGSDDILVRHVPNNTVIDTSSTSPVKNEFLYSIEYEYYYKVKAHKEHLYKHCRNCQWHWREKTKDDDEISLSFTLSKDRGNK